VLTNSVAVSAMAFALIFGAALFGFFLRTVLPEHNLSADSKDVVKLGMGLVSTMAALVLGLLIASAKSSYDAQSAALMDNSAKVVLLDRVLSHYGPETKETRELLRASVLHILDRTWPKAGENSAQPPDPSTGAEILLDKILELSPKDETQHALKTQALNILWGLGQTRWLQYTEQSSSISTPLLTTLVFWLAVVFVSFGLFAPRNAIVISSIAMSAAAVCGAIFMILEMYRPYKGLLQISSAPLRAALAQLGR
jgi:hypothetical protein